MNLQHLDMNALSKGAVINTKTLVRVVGCQPTDRDFALRVLAVKEAVVEHFRKAGQVVTVRCSNDTLEILEDGPASAYNAKAFRVGIRKCVKSRERLVAVDQGKLTDDELKQHQRAVDLTGRVLQAIKQEQNAKPKPVTRPEPRTREAS